MAKITELAGEWCLISLSPVIAKSSRNDRIRENADVFDFKISQEDTERLDTFIS
jgi:diketogulonate reductase-like aldo/keto reductase